MAVEIEQELTISDYWSVIKRRWRTILIAWFLTLVLGVIVAFSLPSVYRSEGLITIESPSISKGVLGQSDSQISETKYIDERIHNVKQKILSRENLVNINKKYNLFPNLKNPTKIAEAVRKSISILDQKKSTDGTTWGQMVTVALVVGFNYSDPNTTHKVAGELVAQLLEQNTKDRTIRATETAAFLTEEVNTTKDELGVVESKVAAYKKKHSDSLPEHQQMHMAMLDQLRTNIKQLDRDYKTTQEELRYLDVEFMTTSATLAKTDIGDGTTKLAISSLDKAKVELDRALVLYKETHPTIRALKRKIILLEKNEQPSAGVTKKPKKTNVLAELALAKINTQVQAARARLDSVSTKKRSTMSQMTKLQARVVKIPQVEVGLFALLRDYENIKQKYEEVKARQVNAKIAEKLELTNKTERFILKRSPEFPEYRMSPKRKNIVAMVFLAGLGLGLGVAVLLELLDKRVRGQSALTAVANMKPIAVIPYIKTHAELAREKSIVKYVYAFAITLAIFLLIIAIIHFFVMPLNELFAK